MRITKAMIYRQYGIQYKGGKIYCEPLQSWIRPLVKNGNVKIGKGVGTWSTTGGNKAVNADVVGAILQNVADQYTTTNADALRMMCGGTCSVNCPGCYAQAGCYLFFSTRVAIGRNTFLARAFMDWTERAIIAQIKADRFRYFRIHAAGDFFGRDYVEMWQRIAAACADVTFWTYTKQWGRGYDDALQALDSMGNVNIVKSLTADGRINFGHAGYLIRLYKDLKKAGHKVYICRCGIDKNQHCNDCRHCSESEFVLFLEHGTSYRPEEDPDYAEFVELVNSQEAQQAA